MTVKRMKLKSGHEIVELPEKEKEDQRRLFKGFSVDGIRLYPGNWHLLKKFALFADKYFDFKFRTSDTVIMTFPKSGTTWMQEIVWNMKHTNYLDNPIQGVGSNVKCPFIEGDFFLIPVNFSAQNEENDLSRYFTKYCSGKNPADGIFLQLAANTPDPRILKTHLPYSLLPTNMLDICKVIFLVRNPKDVCVSYYHYSRADHNVGYTGNFQQHFDLFLDGKILYGPYWETLKETWERRGHPNLHITYYEDLKTDPIREVSSLNQFLGTDLSPDIIKRVVEETSFDKMKERGTFLGRPEESSDPSSKHPMFRIGKVGSWKKEMTKDQNETMNQWIKENSENGKNFTFQYSE